MDVPLDDPLPYPRVVVVELRGPVEEVAAVRAAIEARAVFNDATTDDVADGTVRCRMSVIPSE